MKSALTISIALLIFTAMPASAQPPVASGISHEVSAHMLTLPSSLDGMVEVQACTACERFSFAMTPEVQFHIGDREVSFGEFKQYTQAHANAVLLLVTSRKQNVVMRLAAP